MAQATLTDAIRTFIVTALACYDTPLEVAVAVKDEYGIEVTRQSVQGYDPTVGKKPAKKWCDLFETTRAKFLDDTSTIPIANRAVRLRRIQRMATAAETKKNYPLAAQLLEQAAKETGGLYTNRRELTGRDGSPLVPDRSLEDLSEAELASLAARLATAEPAT